VGQTRSQEVVAFAAAHSQEAADHSQEAPFRMKAHWEGRKRSQLVRVEGAQTSSCWDLVAAAAFRMVKIAFQNRPAVRTACQGDLVVATPSSLVAFQQSPAVDCRAHREGIVAHWWPALRRDSKNFVAVSQQDWVAAAAAAAAAAVAAEDEEEVQDHQGRLRLNRH
jgi:hypothetical protein